MDSSSSTSAGRRHVNSEWSTRAISQYHKLCSLAALGFTTFRAPGYCVSTLGYEEGEVGTYIREQEGSDEEGRF